MCFSGDKEERHGKSQASFTDIWISNSNFRCSMLSPWMDRRWTFILMASVSRIEFTSRTLERKLVTSQSYTFGPGYREMWRTRSKLRKLNVKSVFRRWKGSTQSLSCCIVYWCVLIHHTVSGQGRHHSSMDVSNPSDNHNPLNLKSIAVDIPDWHWYSWWLKFCTDI